MEKTFSILTIGCKLNQYESEWIREALLRRNWEYRHFGEGAHFCIVNSCTVTAKSDARCRNAVRRMRKAAPDSFILVTGCYAETQPRRLETMSEIDLVLGNDAKRSIPAILDEVAARGGNAPRIEACSIRACETGDTACIDRFLGHSRAFVKVQDGCNASCTYCIVPRARGASRSVPAEAVLSQVQRLSRNGYEEIVLTGIHIGRYGADLHPPLTLASLIEMILDRTGTMRLRLSSIESTEVTQRLIGLVRETERLAPHFHIPLQSGDDSILAAMNRPYRAVDFIRRIEEVARAREGIAIGTDIIVGFPGESDEHFECTYSLVHDLPISYFHVFSFSPRPLTPAAAMGAQVSPAVRKTRSRRLIDLGKQKKRAFLESQIGTTQLTLVEGPASCGESFTRSLTGNYCEVILPSRGVRAGVLIPARIDRFSRGNLHGTPLGVPIAGGAASEACEQ
jgi:threonylcarbamoyladenosine tRNA methylthiotransferase MtaB